MNSEFTNLPQSEILNSSSQSEVLPSDATEVHGMEGADPGGIVEESHATDVAVPDAAKPTTIGSVDSSASSKSKRQQESSSEEEYIDLLKNDVNAIYSDAGGLCWIELSSCSSDPALCPLQIDSLDFRYILSHKIHRETGKVARVESLKRIQHVFCGEAKLNRRSVYCSEENELVALIDSLLDDNPIVDSSYPNFLASLRQEARKFGIDDRELPSGTVRLGRELKRIRPYLEEIGIRIEFKRTSRQRRIELSRIRDCVTDGSSLSPVLSRDKTNGESSTLLTESERDPQKWIKLMKKESGSKDETVV